MNKTTTTPRHPKAIISAFINNFIYIRNPYIIMWWSAALPSTWFWSYYVMPVFYRININYLGVLY
jgi:uncharacterized membrane protein